MSSGTLTGDFLMHTAVGSTTYAPMLADSEEDERALLVVDQTHTSLRCGPPGGRARNR
jgi:hypothetical protein